MTLLSLHFFKRARGIARAISSLRHGTLLVRSELTAGTLFRQRRDAALQLCTQLPAHQVTHVAALKVAPFGVLLVALATRRLIPLFSSRDYASL